MPKFKMALIIDNDDGKQTKKGGGGIFALDLRALCLKPDVFGTDYCDGELVPFFLLGSGFAGQGEVPVQK